MGEKGGDMNNIISNFSQILQHAQEDKVPLGFNRAILREYLQSMVISTIFATPESQKLSFVGGTSLRLLRSIDRFSEDLDFDNLGLLPDQFKVILDLVLARFDRENIVVSLKSVQKGEKQYYELRFPELLYDLKISTNDKEKLMIKIDQSSTWQGQKPEVILFSKYGFLEQVKTNSLGQLLVQKMRAYVSRLQTQPRDLYDIVWLYAHGARFDQEFAQDNHLDDLREQAIQKYESESVTKKMISRLQPFLFNQNSINSLQHLHVVLKNI